MMTELVRKAELATERLAAQLAARGSGGAAALSACSPDVPPAVGDLIHAVRSSAHVRASAQGLAGAGSSCGAAPRCTRGWGFFRPASAASQSMALGREGDVSDQWCGYRQCLHTNAKALDAVASAKLPCGLCAVQIHAHVHMTQLHVKRMCCACNTV